MSHTIEILDDEEQMIESLKRAKEFGSIALRRINSDHSYDLDLTKRIARTAAHHAREYMKCQAVTDSKES